MSEFPWWFLAIILIAIWAAFIISRNEFLFYAGLEFVDDLNAGQATELLYQEFESHEISLAETIEIEIQKVGTKWKIISGNKEYFINLDDQSLSIYTTGSYRKAFEFIKAGLSVTIRTSLIAYGFALLFGLLAGLGRISSNVVFNNLARLYVELIRGIPMLVLIFFIALVGVPIVVESLIELGLPIDVRDISMSMRAITALSVTYGAFLAEIFRAGIQSIGRGQMEAARSLGMSYGQAMRYIILPQAIRNVLPALGNDFVAMVKDSSLVSVLAVRDITQMARLHAGSTFRFREAYITLAVMYLTMTVALSLVVQIIERRLRAHD
ncbi:MAG: amino acid ABC transporter permease [Chloroflexi bacterium]|nr:amino acid ABC transporter permease [Chloroflexota bacterium]MBU1660004.1 amino acid ABC transporter permease [Chloroflexota bacterium]